MRPDGSRTYHDPLHGAIALNGSDPVEALLIQLIDTPAFQRLRRIRQLGPASLTFHGAEGSRFTHSLGVMVVARRAFDRLSGRYKALAPHRATVLAAAMLHDIGHGPFSHTCEEIFGSQHEHWTRRILREHTPIRKLLDGFDLNLLEAIELVYQKQHPVPLVWQLVSSQLDCDRLDYLMRDSYFTGTSYGRLDLDRILMAMDYDPATQQLVSAENSMAAIEHYLIVRYFMYAQIYNHPKNHAATWVLQRLFQRAQYCHQHTDLWVDKTVAVWLTQDCNQCDLNHYLSADDGVFLYHLQQWQGHRDPILADLSRRFVNRDLPKALDITHLTAEQQQTVLQDMRGVLNAHGWSPEDYAGIRTALSRGYTLYQRGIKLKTVDGLVELSARSPLVKTLTDPWQRHWLIYPREFESEVLALVSPYPRPVVDNPSTATDGV